MSKSAREKAEKQRLMHKEALRRKVKKFLEGDKMQQAEAERIIATNRGIYRPDKSSKK